MLFSSVPHILHENLCEMLGIYWNRFTTARPAISVCHSRPHDMHIHGILGDEREQRNPKDENECSEVVLKLVTEYKKNHVYHIIMHSWAQKTTQCTQITPQFEAREKWVLLPKHCATIGESLADLGREKHTYCTLPKQTQHRLNGSVQHNGRKQKPQRTRSGLIVTCGTTTAVRVATTLHCATGKSSTEPSCGKLFTIESPTNTENVRVPSLPGTLESKISCDMETIAFDSTNTLKWQS